VSRPIDQADHNSNDNPLDEIRYGLLERQSQADIEIYKVMDHERTNGEEADQGAEARAFCKAGTVAIEHGVNHGQSQHTHKHGRDSGGHHALDSFLGTINGGIFEKFSFHRRNGERQTA
jgi:hypothetical protein